MKLWLVFVAMAVVTLVYIMIPVALAARGYFRRYKLVRCRRSRCWHPRRPRWDGGGVRMPLAQTDF